jgi:hypothetical protein
MAKKIAVRLILQDVGDGVLRQYQIDGFAAASAPANNLQSEDLQKWGQGDATHKIVAQAVSAFKPDRRLFQKNQGPSGSIEFKPDHARCNQRQHQHKHASSCKSGAKAAVAG